MAVTRLLVFGTRRAWGRLAGIVAGIGIGVILALQLIAGSNALEARDLRASWLNPTLSDIESATAGDTIAAPSDDIFEGQRIRRLDIAMPPDATVTLPGLEAPAPGLYLASPALEKLIQGAAPENLQNRYGSPTGTIPLELLASPDSLAVVVGGTPDQVEALSSTGVVESFGGAVFGGNQNYQILAVVGALALLIPAFLLVSVSTMLGAAARSERWQTLSTIGAPRKVVRRVARAEATGTALLGAILGVAGFFALRPLLALLPVAGERFVASDLTVPVPAVLVLVAGVILGSVGAATWSVRRAGSSPTTRAVFEREPSFWRLVPLTTALMLFLLINVFADQTPIPLMIPVVMSFGLLVIGLLVAGPYLTWASGRIFERVAGTGDTVVASRRIMRTPRAGFRSVAGLVAATFVITVFAFVTSAHVSADAYTADALLPEDTIAASLRSGVHASESAIHDALREVPGITEVFFTYTDGERIYLNQEDAEALTGTTFPGEVAEIVGGVYSLVPDGPGITAAHVTTLDGLHVRDVIVRTDGEPTALETIRTALLSLDEVDRASGSWTRAEYVSDTDSDLATQFTEIGRLAIGIVTALAASVLTVSTIAALYDRKRTFGLLHLIGMPPNTLRKIITWETVVPLLSIVVPTILLGWFTAWFIITTLSSRSLGWPDSLLTISLAATALMACASILIASRVGSAITRAVENTRHE